MRQLYILTKKAVLLLAVFAGMTTTVQAAGQWQWQVTLDASTSGKAMDMPSAVYVDGDKQRYYVVDSGNNRLLSFERDGKFLHAFTAEGSLQRPFDMVRDEDGIFWVVEKGKNSLTAIDVAAKSITPRVLRDGDHTIVADRLTLENNLFYVLDASRGDIAVLNKELVVEKWFSCADCSGGFVDFKIVKGTVWALDRSAKNIVQLAADGSLKSSFSVGEHAAFPVSMAVGPSGFVYVLDRHEGIIAVFDAGGSYKYSFLSGGQMRGQLHFPVEIDFDPWGRLCVVEEGNSRVEVFGR